MWALRENGHKLSPSEFERIFKYFDKNNCGRVCYNDFMAGIRPAMNERRCELAKQAFAAVDKEGCGSVSLEQIFDHCDVSGHPKIKSGEMTT